MMDHYLLVHHVELRAEHLRVDPAVDEDQSRIVRLDKIRYQGQSCSGFRCCLILFPGRTACNVSGVVMRRSGGLPAILRRSAAGVSPCLTSTVKPSLADQI